MTFGLLSQAYNGYAISNGTDTREKYRGTKKSLAKHYMSWPMRGAYTILEIALTILALLCLWDCYVVKGWDTWLLVLLLILFFAPLLGDVLALTIIIYWVIEVRRSSVILSKLNV